MVGRFSGAGGRATPSACAGVLGAFLGLNIAFPVSAAPTASILDSVVVDQESSPLKAAAPHFRVRPPWCSKAASPTPIAQAHLALADPETRAVAYSVLGTIRVQQKRLAESVVFLQKAIQLEPRLIGAHLTLAQVYLLQRKPRQRCGTSSVSSSSIRRTCRLDSRWVVRPWKKATTRGSLALVRPVEAAIAQSPEGLFVLVTDLLKTGDRTAAAPLVKAWNDLPDVPLRSGDRVRPAAYRRKDGPRCHRRARARETPRSAVLRARVQSRRCLSGQRRPAAALEAYDLALTLQPASLPALRQAAAIAERQGELERSLSYWIRARKIAANDPRSFSALAACV